MAKLILLITITCAAISCSQNSKSIEDSHRITSTDTALSKKQTEVDTTMIDVVMVSPGLYKVLLENEYVRVIEYSLKPGQKDNPHRHPAKTSYVISGGILRVYPENEMPFDVEEIKGTSEWSDKSGNHYVENIGKTTITILLTEIKNAH